MSEVKITVGCAIRAFAPWRSRFSAIIAMSMLMSKPWAAGLLNVSEDGVRADYDTIETKIAI